LAAQPDTKPQEMKMNTELKALGRILKFFINTFAYSWLLWSVYDMIQWGN
jgi:hypothetical protein